MKTSENLNLRFSVFMRQKETTGVKCVKERELLQIIRGIVHLELIDNPLYPLTLLDNFWTRNYNYPPLPLLLTVYNKKEI